MSARYSPVHAAPRPRWPLPVALATVAVVAVALLAMWLRPEPTGSFLPAADTSTSPSPDAPAVRSVTITGVGDTVMGAIPDALPPNAAAGFFDRVSEHLSGDVVFGNLEGPLSERTDFKKCGEDDECVYIRMPPAYAPVLADAGFTVLNIANNHGFDAGPDGVGDTRAALDAEGIPLAGVKGEIVELETPHATVAVVGVATYDFYTNLLDVSAVTALVDAAAQRADIVVLSMHVGAEGVDHRHVTGGPETFAGEDRGDSTAVARAAIDAGADLVLGHGPHVLRGMEFYKGRLVAHSLGNFAGYGVLSANGPLGRGAILSVQLTPDGEFLSGKVVATLMVDGGYPAFDAAGGGIADVTELSADFGDAGVRLSPDGTISPPA
ncbi:CapA family protein [Stackebrandtia soli]|uniref:CapA family protein n=1 Tax=Stackebrandtia soli TaxID=1892856 RepID=UPI0039E7B101